MGTLPPLTLDATTYRALTSEHERDIVTPWLERVLGTTKATACDLIVEGQMAFDVVVFGDDGAPVIAGEGDDRYLATRRVIISDQPPEALLRAVVEAHRRG